MDFQNKQWYNIYANLVFARGWQDTPSPFGRLPQHAQNLLPEKVWKMGRNSSGMYVEFYTNSSSISVKWLLKDEDFGELNFNVCSYSGIDLFCYHQNKWRFVVAASALAKDNNLEILSNLPKKQRLFRLYFPFRNEIDNIAIGIDENSQFSWVEPQNIPQIIYYGSSIIHGSCTSRAGNGITSLLGRKFNTPVVNLGFSGAAKLELEMAKLLLELDSLFYIIDPLPNCDTALVAANLEPFLRCLCSNKKDTPVFLLTDANRRGAWIHPQQVKAHCEKRLKAKEIVLTLQKEFPQLYFIDMAKSMGSDFEGTVDGIHPDQLGVTRFTNFLIKKLQKHL
jgi:hypothetical protein